MADDCPKGREGGREGEMGDCLRDFQKAFIWLEMVGKRINKTGFQPGLLKLLTFFENVPL